MSMFKKSKLTILAYSLTICLGLSQTPKSEALIPTTDVAGLAESIAANIQALHQWAEQKSMMMMEMDMMAMMEELSVDNENNAISNVIVRTGAAMQEIQNLEVIEQSIPDKDSCRTIAVQVSLGDALCVVADKIAEKTDERLEKNSGFNKPSSKQIKERNQIAKDFVEQCLELQEGIRDPETPIKKSMCLKASILTGGSTIDTYDPNQEKAVNKFIELIAGPIPTIKETGTLSNSGASQNKKLIQEMRKEAFRALVDTSLSEVAGMRTSPNGTELSPLHHLSEFDKTRFGSVDWMATLQNVNPDKKNSVYPSEIMRKMAVMDSFMVHMTVLQYKQQLRIEAIQAGHLALDVEPLK